MANFRTSEPIEQGNAPLLQPLGLPDPGNSPETPRDEIVKALGGRVEIGWETCNRSSADRAIQVDNFRDFQIYTSPLADWLSRRHTIAHELGHYFLHAPVNAGEKLVATETDSPTGERTAEREAEWFATSPLLTKEQVKNIHAQKKGKLVDIAHHVGGSFNSLRRRIVGLRLERPG